MGKLKKVVRGLGIFIVSLILLIGVYILFLRPEKASLFRYAPEDAFLMFYSRDFKDTWEDIRESGAWNILQRQSFVDSSRKMINVVDSVITTNPFINKLVEDHALLMSLHPVEKEGLEPLFFLDMMELSKLRFSVDLLEKKVLNNTKYKLRKKKIYGEMVYELHKTGKSYYLAFRDNVLILSSNRELVKEALIGEENQWVKSEGFRKLKEEFKKGDRIHFYVNFSEIESVLKTQKLDPEEYKLWLDPLEYGAYNLEFDDDVIHLRGGISARPNTHGYLNAFTNVDIGQPDAYKVISKDVATYLSFNFEQFDAFNTSFKHQLAAIDSKSYSNYIQRSNQLEKALDIDIQDHLFNWMDDELVLGKLKPRIGASQVNDLFLAIHVSNPKTAEEMLSIVTDKVAAESPLKFRSQQYRDHTIRYLDLKGFFKLFAGNLFEKLDRPYYTIIDEYVVFSNSVNNLITLLDHRAKQQTLEHDETFDELYNNFDETGNVQLFINSHELYESVYYHTDAHTQNFLKKNRHLLMLLEGIALQVKPKAKIYESELRLKLTGDPNLEGELGDFETDASKSEHKIIENLEFTLDPSAMGISKDSTGMVNILYPDSSLWYEGQVVDGKPHRLWRSFYESGQLKSSVIYNQGKVNKDAVFYYDNPGNTIHIKAQFAANKLINTYKEFYKNGQMKAVIEYDEGLADGDARFYYSNGNLKMTGNYRNGKRTGKWLFYGQQGKLLQKIKQ